MRLSARLRDGIGAARWSWPMDYLIQYAATSFRLGRTNSGRRLWVDRRLRSWGYALHDLRTKLSEDPGPPHPNPSAGPNPPTIPSAQSSASVSEICMTNFWFRTLGAHGRPPSWTVLFTGADRIMRHFRARVLPRVGNLAGSSGAFAHAGPLDTDGTEEQAHAIFLLGKDMLDL